MYVLKASNLSIYWFLEECVCIPPDSCYVGARTGVEFPTGNPRLKGESTCYWSSPRLARFSSLHRAVPSEKMVPTLESAKLQISSLCCLIAKNITLSSIGWERIQTSPFGEDRHGSVLRGPTPLARSSRHGHPIRQQQNRRKGSSMAYHLQLQKLARSLSMKHLRISSDARDSIEAVQSTWLDLYPQAADKMNRLLCILSSFILWSLN